MKNLLVIAFLLFFAAVDAQNISGEGLYVDLDGNKHFGKIKLKVTRIASGKAYTQSSFQFKSKEGEKLELKASQVQLLVIEEDTFNVIKDYTIQVKDLGKARVFQLDYEFIQILAVGELSVYRQRLTFAGDGYIYMSLHLSKNNSTYVFLNDEVLMNAIKDKPSVYERWNGLNKNKRINKQIEIVKDYNSN